VASSKYARLVDHELSWALTNLKRDGLAENPRWSTWTLTGVACESTPSIAAEPVDEARLTALRSMPYRLYLRTPEWRRTRSAALVRAGSRCSLDAKHVKGLEVHHSSYERLGKELESDLTVLCRSCHERFHAEPERAGGSRQRLWYLLARRWSRQPQA
jgi:5-methylcytosine-specific restriction endonuclease McrA